MAESSNGITWINSLKGLAICGVVMIHSGGAELPSFWGKIGNIGKNGVQLFLILSVYLTYISLDNFMKKSKEIYKWWIRKFVRLIPIYYLAVVVYTMYGGNKYWLGNEVRVTWKNIVAHLLFLHGLVPHYANSIIGGEWYIGVLSIIYILIPFLSLYINSLERSIIAFFSSIFLCKAFNIFCYWILSQEDDFYIYDNFFGTFFFFSHIPVILLGIMLYFFIKKDIVGYIKEKKKLSYILLIFSLFMLGGQALDKNKVFGISFATLCGIWFCGIIISQNIAKCTIIDNKLFEGLGRYSFSIYLFHLLFIAFYEKVCAIRIENEIINWFVKYFFVLGCSYIVSRIVTEFYEKPLLGKLNKVIDKFIS